MSVAAPGAVLFLSDEHNPRVAGPYGHPRVETPAMDRLAAAGTVYDACYCPSPLCLPSRSALMAGRRVHQLRTYSNCNLDLPRPEPISYGAVLDAAGVHAAYIGKTDVYAPAAELGFTEMIRGGDRALPGDRNHRRNPMSIRAEGARRADGFGPRDDAFAGDLGHVDAAVDWLRHTAPGLTRPWLLVVNTGKPHFPHHVTQDLWERYADAGDLPAHGLDCDSARHPHAANLRRHFQTEGFTPDQVRGLRRGYLGCVTFVDTQLGRVLDALDETGLSASTVTVYASDHGDMLGTFGMWWKCSLYEDSVRVPCIAAGPGVAAGARVGTPVDLHDVRAGLLAHLGVAQPAGWVGQPLQEIADGDGERVVVSEYHGHGATGSAYMVRRDRWKWIHYSDAPAQLFDLVDDPEELIDLSRARPAVAAQLHEELVRVCDPDAENRRAEAFIESQLARLQGGARLNHPPGEEDLAMAHTYDELRKMKVDQLREIASGLDDERLEGNSQMNKDHLLPLLCEVLGVDAHAHHQVMGVDKRSIKGQIKALKVDRDQALADKDRVRLKEVRRQIRKLKHKLHKAMV